MVAPAPTQRKRPRRRRLLPAVCLLGIIGVVLFAMLSGSGFLDEEDGRVVLSPERQAKLQRELDELENAEQYVLIASRDGYYPCYHCGEKTTIFLRKGEVWKYGVVRSVSLSIA